MTEKQTCKTLQDLSLFSKYQGLKRAYETIKLNRTVFRDTFSDEMVLEQLAMLDDPLSNIQTDLEAVVEEHRDLFLEKCDDLLGDDNMPSDSMLKVYLAIVFMSDGDVTSCLTFLTDLLGTLYEDMEAPIRVQLATDYTRDAVEGGMLVPKVMTLAEDGTEVDRQDLEDLHDEIPVNKMIFDLTAAGRELISDVIKEVNSRQERLVSATKKIEHLMSMDSPSKLLN